MPKERKSAPRKKWASKRQKNSGNGAYRTRRSIVPFRSVNFTDMSTSAGFTIVAFSLNIDVMGPVALQAADGFEHYRVTKLRIKVRPPLLQYTSAGTSYENAIGYSGIEVASGSLSSFNAMAAMDVFSMGTGATNACSVSVNRTVLIGNEPTKWFHCRTGTGLPAAYVNQGVIYYGYYNDIAYSNTNRRLWVELDGVVEFSTPFDPSISTDSAPPLKLLCCNHFPSVGDGVASSDDNKVLDTPDDATCYVQVTEEDQPHNNLCAPKAQSQGGVVAATVANSNIKLERRMSSVVSKKAI